MQILFWTFLGGVTGAVLMDIAETLAAGRGIASGVTPALIGRWFLNLLQRKFKHTDILESEPLPHEVIAGQAFHYLVGGGGVALSYPFFFFITGLEMPHTHLLSGLVFGLATSLLPWFILLPSFGWGICGVRGPRHANPLLASTLAHVPYGFGVGFVLTAAPI